MALNLDPFLGTFGYPPSTWISDEMIINSMPVMEIIPCEPVFESGLNLFSLSESTDKFSEILGNHGFSTPTPIRAAFIADNFPTDSFTNDYGETFLQKFTDVTSMGMSQLAQMTRSKSGTEAIQNIANISKEMGDDFGGVAGGIISGAAGAAGDLAGGVQNMIKKMEAGEANSIGNMLGGGAGLVNKMLGGHRVDFPQVWRNSGYTPSYTATIRLYNPNPGSKESTLKYIVGPIAVFLLMTMPRSEDGNTYIWPFFHKIKAKGIYNLDPCVITNVTVIKGGDQQQIAYNQKLAVVDVRMDFTSLYNTIIAEEGNSTFTNRPTLREYLSVLNEDDGTIFSNREQMRRITSSKAGVPDAIGTPQRGFTAEEQLLIAKNNAARQQQAPLVSNPNANGRVSTVNAQRQLLLQNNNPTIG